MSAIPENATSAASPIPATIPQLDTSGPRSKRWTREEYHRLAESGWFQDERVELVDGEILVMSPQSPDHFLTIERIRRCLETVFGEEFWVRLQGPVVKGDTNEPEPDLCVVPGPPEKYVEHPTSALLVVEVSKTSLGFDTQKKQSLYASMGVPDYWVLDLENRQLLVFRKPLADESADFGHRYESVETIAAEGNVSPLEKPDARLAVANMLPPIKK